MKKYLLMFVPACAAVADKVYSLKEQYFVLTILSPRVSGTKDRDGTSLSLLLVIDE
jgi:putative effector of murein hydrolase LrgA (UPF0299 family)